MCFENFIFLKTFDLDVFKKMKLKKNFFLRSEFLKIQKNSENVIFNFFEFFEFFNLAKVASIFFARGSKSAVTFRKINIFQ